MKPILLLLLFPAALLAQESLNLTTDEPVGLMGKPGGAPNYEGNRRSPPKNSI